MKSRGYEQFVQIDDFTFDSRDLWMVEELMQVVNMWPFDDTE